MYVAQPLIEDFNHALKRARVEVQLVLSFSDEDKFENLTVYNSPLVSFDGKVVISKGQIRLPVQAGSKVVEVNFIVVDAYSPYMAIVARLWLHALGVVSSTLRLKGFEWTEECVLAFQQLKEYLSLPPIMSRPEVDEVLFAYIAVASHVVSLVLVRVDSGVQRPVYYVSKSLYATEVRYLPLEKAILAVVHATRKLPHYFQSHIVVVLTQLRLRSLLQSADYRRRIAKWVEIFTDSRLVVGQVQGELEAKDYIPRSGNTHANSLATLATFSAQSLSRVILVKDLCKPIEVKREMVHIHQIRVGPSWMDPIALFLKEDIFLEEKSEVDKILRKTPRFWLSENQKLYKRSFFGPYLLCIHLEASELILEELHEGICGRNKGGKSLSHRALTQEL
ncbi:uncharacterized protein LOC126704342 [Quercus robur]|uniref:uncharacterized protein LOC126704342 n=1 Tax=Quercus robur TaxID=38942 RepID=UPI002163B6F8|nr:uncharacterized protein LOC126704342 [Quercus robur]